MLAFAKKHPYITLILFSLYLFLIGNQLLAVTDTAESNYALTAKEMVLSGDWLSPQIYGHYWYDKPIFYYWTLAASFAVFGFNEFAARFPSAVFGCLNVCFLFWFVRRIYDERTAWLSSLILAASLEFWILSKAVITDAALFLFMSAAVAAFYLGYKEDRRWYFLCYAAAGLAVLTKGPIGLALPGFSCLLFLLWKKDLKEMLHVHFLSGMLLFLLVGGSWYFYMYLAHGADFILNFFGVHNFLRATVAEHERQNVWYFYIMMFFAGFAPWSFALPWSLWKKYKAKTLSLSHLTDADRFLLTWAFSVLLIFQLIATKYTTYTFPSLFAFAILAARLWAFHPKMIARTAAGAAVVYTVLALFIVPSVMLRNSGKEVGTMLSALDRGNEAVFFYDGYRTSAVFYSGREIDRLESAEEIEKTKPGTLSWNAKNVMPFFPMEELDDSDACLVIVPQEKKKDFLQDAEGRWVLCAAAGKYDIWQPAAAPAHHAPDAAPYTDSGLVTAYDYHK